MVKPVFKLSGDAEDLTYWIDAIPTPEQARQLLEENDGPSKEERGNPPSRAVGRAENMRILLAFDEEYRLYIDAIADAIRTFRSYAEVAVTNTGELEAAVERFHPQLVICSSPIPSNPVEPQLIASIELSPESDQPSKFRIGARHWELTNPTLGETLSVVDETNWLYKTSQEEEPTDNGEAEG